MVSQSAVDALGVVTSKSVPSEHGPEVPVAPALLFAAVGISLPCGPASSIYPTKAERLNTKNNDSNFPICQN